MSKPASTVPSLGDSPRLSIEKDIEQASAEKQMMPPTETAPMAIDASHPSQFPDGGKDAWLCLLGAFCGLFCSFGWINCVGVYQSYYQTHQLRQYSPSTIAWIPSCEIFVMFLPGPIVGFFYDNHGPKYLLVFGTFFHVLGLMMTSLAREYYQFILAQGICSPLGLNCIFAAASSSVTTWFFRKRGLAFGIMAAGSGLGGIILPMMTSHLIPKVGYGWTMRICAFLILGLCCIAILTIKSRLPPKARPFQLHVFLEPFTDVKYLSILAASFLFFLGMFIPINFIEVQALASGMSLRLAGYLIPILNATSIFGRLVPGALADKVGRFNMQTAMSFFAAAVALAFGFSASGNAAFIVYAGLYGFASGAYVSLLPAQVASVSEVKQIGVRTGIVFSVNAFAGLAGSPIAGAIVTRNRGSYDGLTMFAGVMLLAGATLFGLSRCVVSKWQLAAKV